MTQIEEIQKQIKKLEAEINALKAPELEVEFTKLHKDAIIPDYAHTDDSGMDIYTIEDFDLLPGETKLIKTGLAVALPPNTEFQVRPKSGIALKNNVTVLNTPGTVDEGYRGEIGVILFNAGKTTLHRNKGEKIAQLVLCTVKKAKVIEKNQLSKTSRGAGGFGSTGIEKNK